MTRLVLVLALVMLAGCCRPEMVRVPVPVPGPERLVVQPVSPQLLRLHPAEPAAPEDLHQCPQIARQRLAQLQACNHDKAQIRAAGHAAEQDPEHHD